MKRNRKDLYEQLRGKYSTFTYEDFSYAIINNELRIKFDFILGEKYSFKPVHKIPLPKNFDTNILSDSLIRNIIFNLGMVELVSYWKAACPKQVIIKTAALTDVQIDFWKKLYRYGLGEFFYINGITPADDFMEITVSGNEVLTKKALQKNDNNKVLVPIGGGKDSIVTLELLSQSRECIPFIMNPRPASLQTAINANYTRDDIITSDRSIDKGLLELNDKGYLNGHTPFSAVLAFTSVLVACIYGIPKVALSNESSANEPTIPGTNINHQYSKSLEFENDFRDYLSSYITEDIQYYSFLRPLNELQIAKIFSAYPAHFDSFRSCNAGSKTDSWCGECAKCLFTFIILSPYIDHEMLVRIFGKDLIEDEGLAELFEQLTGYVAEKPFECIGTIEEVNAAIKYYAEHAGAAQLPALIKKYWLLNKDENYSEVKFQGLLQEFGEHNIPCVEDVILLKNALNDI